MEFLRRIWAVITALWLMLIYGRVEAQKMLYDEEIFLEQEIAAEKAKIEEKRAALLDMTASRIESIKDGIEFCSETFGPTSKSTRRLKGQLVKWESMQKDFLVKEF